MEHARLGAVLAMGLGLLLAWPATGNHVVMHGGPFGGVVVQLLPHPEVPGTLYLAAFGSGVYRSEDSGRTWIQSSQGLDDPTVLALAMDPAAPRVLYAGTDSGAFISRDGARTWARLGRNLRGRNVRSLLVVPERPTRLYAATDQGILVSWDEGQSWTPRIGGLASRDIRVLRLDPANPGRLYAAGFGGVYRSEDGGRHWHARNDGLGDRRVRALALDPRRPDVLYVGTAGSGVYMSSDRGGRWEPRNQGLRNLTILSLLVAPDGQLFVGTVGGVFRWGPQDAGWQLLGEGLLTLTVTFVAADPHRPGTLYAGTGGLVFVSEDHGQQWRELAVSVAAARPPRTVSAPPRPAGAHASE
jgi:photosystem II stability/assembly factor-like uncharacterized protein